jgi:23S rRNA (adenine1618-N6)-methyltransferase
MKHTKTDKAPAKRPKQKRPKEKSALNPRNRHLDRYDLKALTVSCPSLAPFIIINKYNQESVDFADPKAVKMLNTALLKHFYDITDWDIPPGYLCPPIPGRADYIHHIADMLAARNHEIIPTGSKIRCLDIGVGANCVYPIIGHKEYGWAFVGTDIDPVSIESANRIIAANSFLQTAVECRLQTNPKNIFNGVVQSNEKFDLVLCNPPFHKSPEEAQSGTLRKLNNLNPEKITAPTLNFGGKNTELWCVGGEERFIGDMIRQSKQFATNCCWFSSLVSKQSSLKNIYRTLEKMAVTEVVTIPMGQGNKISRIVAWSFLTKEQQEGWRGARWGEAV